MLGGGTIIETKSGDTSVRWVLLVHIDPNYLTTLAVEPARDGLPHR